MDYSGMLPAIFLSRPNRFISICQLDGQPVVAHVKNTGRCRELLIPGTQVLLERAKDPSRKTQYTLTHVQKGKRLIQIDSQAPNRLVLEALQAGTLTLPHLGKPDLIRPETMYGESRLDFYLEAEGKKAFAEVKGVTLERENWAYFPDAPTQRGIKHLEHLAKAVREGYLAYVIFVIQMEGMEGFSPNWQTHPAFGQALLDAREAGVIPLAFSARMTSSYARLAEQVPIDLRKGEKENAAKQ